MPIKLNFENEIHLLNVDPTSFQQLRQLIIQSYSQLKDQSLIFKYTDIEDGDIITISCDSDLEIFLQEFKNHNKTPKILIEIDSSSSILPQSEYDIVGRIESQFQTIQLSNDNQCETDMVLNNEQLIKSRKEFQQPDREESPEEEDTLVKVKSNSPTNMIEVLANKLTENYDKKQKKKDCKGVLNEKKIEKIRQIVREEIRSLVKEECLKLFESRKAVSGSKSPKARDNQGKLLKKKEKQVEKQVRKASQSGSRSPVARNDEQETSKSQKKERRASQSGSKSPLMKKNDQEAPKKAKKNLVKGQISSDDKELKQQQKLLKQQEKQRLEEEEKAKKLQEKAERKEKLERIKQAKLELELKKQSQKNSEMEKISEPVFGAKINNILINENAFESTILGKKDSPRVNMIPMGQKNGSVVEEPLKLITPSIYEITYNNMCQLEPNFLKLDKAVILQDFKNLNIVNVNLAYNWYLDQNIKF